MGILVTPATPAKGRKNHRFKPAILTE